MDGLLMDTGPLNGYLNYCSVLEKYAKLATGITTENDYENDYENGNAAFNSGPSAWVRNSLFEPAAQGTSLTESAEQMAQGLRQQCRDLGLPEDFDDLFGDDDGVPIDGMEEMLEEEESITDEHDTTTHIEEDTATVASLPNRKSQGKSKKNKISSIKKKKKTLAMTKHMKMKKKLNRSLRGRRSLKKNKNQNTKWSRNSHATTSKSNRRKSQEEDSKKLHTVTATSKHLDIMNIPLKKLIMSHREKQSNKIETTKKTKERLPNDFINYNIFSPKTKKKLTNDRSARLKKRVDEATLQEKCLQNNRSTRMKKRCSLQKDHDTKKKKDETKVREEENIQKVLVSEKKIKGLSTNGTKKGVTIVEKINLKHNKQPQTSNNQVELEKYQQLKPNEEEKLQSNVSELNNKKKTFNKCNSKRIIEKESVEQINLQAITEVNSQSNNSNHDKDPLDNRNNIKRKMNRSARLMRRAVLREENVRKAVNKEKKNKDEKKIREEESLQDVLEHFEQDNCVVLEKKNEGLSTNEKEKDVIINERVNPRHSIQQHTSNSDIELERYQQLKPIEEEEDELKSNEIELNDKQEPGNKCNSKRMIEKENVDKNKLQKLKEVNPQTNNIIQPYVNNPFVSNKNNIKLQMNRSGRLRRRAEKAEQAELREQESLIKDFNTKKKNKGKTKIKDKENIQKTLITEKRHKDKTKNRDKENMQNSLLLEKEKLMKYQQLKPSEKENEFQINLSHLENEHLPMNKCKIDKNVEKERVVETNLEVIQEVNSHSNIHNHDNDQINSRKTTMLNKKNIISNKQKSASYISETKSNSKLGRFNNKIFKAKNNKRQSLSDVLLIGLTCWHKVFQFYEDNVSNPISKQLIKVLKKKKVDKILALKPNVQTRKEKDVPVIESQIVAKSLISSHTIQNKQTDMDHKKNEKGCQIRNIHNLDSSVNEKDKQVTEKSVEIENPLAQMIISSQDKSQENLQIVINSNDYAEGATLPEQMQCISETNLYFDHKQNKNLGDHVNNDNEATETLSMDSQLVYQICQHEGEKIVDFNKILQVDISVLKGRVINSPQCDKRKCNNEEDVQKQFVRKGSKVTEEEPLFKSPPRKIKKRKYSDVLIEGPKSANITILMEREENKSRPDKFIPEKENYCQNLILEHTLIDFENQTATTEELHQKQLETYDANSRDTPENARIMNRTERNNVEKLNEHTEISSDTNNVHISVANTIDVSKGLTTINLDIATISKKNVLEINAEDNAKKNKSKAEDIHYMKKTVKEVDSENYDTESMAKVSKTSINEDVENENDKTDSIFKVSKTSNNEDVENKNYNTERMGKVKVSKKSNNEDAEKKKTNNYDLKDEKYNKKNKKTNEGLRKKIKKNVELESLGVKKQNKQIEKTSDTISFERRFRSRKKIDYDESNNHISVGVSKGLKKTQVLNIATSPKTNLTEINICEDVDYEENAKENKAKGEDANNMNENVKEMEIKNYSTDSMAEGEVSKKKKKRDTEKENNKVQYLKDTNDSGELRFRGHKKVDYSESCDDISIASDISRASWKDPEEYRCNSDESTVGSSIGANRSDNYSDKSKNTNKDNKKSSDDMNLKDSDKLKVNKIKKLRLAKSVKPVKPLKIIEKKGKSLSLSSNNSSNKTSKVILNAHDSNNPIRDSSSQSLILGISLKKTCLDNSVTESSHSKENAAMNDAKSSRHTIREKDTQIVVPIKNLKGRSEVSQSTFNEINDPRSFSEKKNGQSVEKTVLKGDSYKHIDKIDRIKERKDENTNYSVVQTEFSGVSNNTNNSTILKNFSGISNKNTNNSPFQKNFSGFSNKNTNNSAFQKEFSEFSNKNTNSSTVQQNFSGFSNKNTNSSAFQKEFRDFSNKSTVQKNFSGFSNRKTNNSTIQKEFSVLSNSAIQKDFNGFPADINDPEYEIVGQNIELKNKLNSSSQKNYNITEITSSDLCGDVSDIFFKGKTTKDGSGKDDFSGSSSVNNSTIKKKLSQFIKPIHLKNRFVNKKTISKGTVNFDYRRLLSEDTTIIAGIDIHKKKRKQNDHMVLDSTHKYFIEGKSAHISMSELRKKNLEALGIMQNETASKISKGTKEISAIEASDSETTEKLSTIISSKQKRSEMFNGISNISEITVDITEKMPTITENQEMNFQTSANQRERLDISKCSSSSDEDATATLLDFLKPVTISHSISSIASLAKCRSISQSSESEITKNVPTTSSDSKLGGKKYKGNFYDIGDSEEEVDMLKSFSSTRNQQHSDLVVVPPHKRPRIDSNLSESGFESGWTQLSNGTRTSQGKSTFNSFSKKTFLGTSTLSSFSKSSSFKKPRLKLAKPR